MLFFYFYVMGGKGSALQLYIEKISAFPESFWEGSEQASLFW